VDTVSVVLRYYAGARAAAGVTEETLRLSGGSTVADALSAAETSRGPALAKVLSACSFLLDGVAVHGRATPLTDGMRLDVLPPFAGG
jgi:molybdopterin converting factor small subunit